MSKAWKDLEKKTAEILHGKRISKKSSNRFFLALKAVGKVFLQVFDILLDSLAQSQRHSHYRRRHTRHKTTGGLHVHYHAK